MTDVIRRLAPAVPLRPRGTTGTRPSLPAIVVPEVVPQVARMVLGLPNTIGAAVVANATGEEVEVMVLRRPTARLVLPTTVVVAKAVRVVPFPTMRLAASPPSLTVLVLRAGLTTKRPSTYVVPGTVDGEVPAMAAPDSVFVTLPYCDGRTGVSSYMLLCTVRDTATTIRPAKKIRHTILAPRPRPNVLAKAVQAALATRRAGGPATAGGATGRPGAATTRRVAVAVLTGADAVTIPATTATTTPSAATVAPTTARLACVAAAKVPEAATTVVGAVLPGATGRTIPRPGGAGLRVGVPAMATRAGPVPTMAPIPTILAHGRPVRLVVGARAPVP